MLIGKNVDQINLMKKGLIYECSLIGSSEAGAVEFLQNVAGIPEEQIVLYPVTSMPWKRGGIMKFFAVRLTEDVPIKQTDYCLQWVPLDSSFDNKDMFDQKLPIKDLIKEALEVVSRH